LTETALFSGSKDLEGSGEGGRDCGEGDDEDGGTYLNYGSLMMIDLSFLNQNYKNYRSYS
jgi:hypothetical protein